MDHKIRILKTFDIPVAFLEWRDDGILKIILKPKSHVDLESSMEIFEIMKSLSSGPKSMLVLTLTSEETTMDKEVREFSTTDESSFYTLGEAVVTRQLAHRLILNFIMKFYKPRRNIRLFGSEQEAVEWLLNLRKSH